MYATGVVSVLKNLQIAAKNQPKRAQTVVEAPKTIAKKSNPKDIPSQPQSLEPVASEPKINICRRPKSSRIEISSIDRTNNLRLL